MADLRCEPKTLSTHAFKECDEPVTVVIVNHDGVIRNHPRGVCAKHVTPTLLYMLGMSDYGNTTVWRADDWQYHEEHKHD